MGFGSKLSSVVSLVSALVFALRVVEGLEFDSLLQLPSRRERFKRVLFVSDFGAVGDGLTNDTQAFKQAWELACSLKGHGRIVIPSGYTFLVHPINFGGPCESKVTLNINGKIVAPEDPASWKGLNHRKWMYFHGVDNLTIEGEGTINGKGWRWWEKSCKINKTNPCRHAPTAITFHKCNNLKLKNITVVYGQQMHITFSSCIRVKAFNLEVVSPSFSPNTDGIHISASRDVVVRDSIVRTGDDCVSMVNNSSQVRIKNIFCGPGHGISIGSLGKTETFSFVRDVIVDGAFLSNTDNGLRIKTWQGGRGNATNIRFLNIFMENVSNPIIIDQYYCDSPTSCSNQTLAVKVENVSFKHVKGTSATEEAIIFACSDYSPCEGIYLEDIELVSRDSEGTTGSLCWQAHGSTHGLVSPPVCFSCNDSLIKLKLKSSAYFRRRHHHLQNQSMSRSWSDAK